MASLRTALVSVGCAIRNLPLAVSSLRRALLLDPTALQRRTNPVAHANSAPTERPDASSKTSVVASARELWRHGHWDQALEVLAHARGGTARRLLRRIRSERELLQSPHSAQALPQSATPARPPFHSKPGCVVHLVTNSLPHTNAGYTTRTQQILLAQKALGLDPHAITRLGHPVAQGVLTARRMDVVDGIRYHRLLPLWGIPGDAQRAMARAIDHAAVLMRTLRPAVLHAATNHANGQLALALRDRFGIPVVYEVRGFLEESWASRAEDPLAARHSDRFQLERELETQIMASADLVTTLGPAMRDEIIARGIPANRIILAPNGVDDRFLAQGAHPTDITDATETAEDLRAQWATPGLPTIGTVSTLYAHEGLDTLLRAAALLKEQGSPVHVLLIGDGPERRNLEVLAHDLGIADTTTVTGRIPFHQVHRYYLALDVFCVPRTAARVSDLVTPLKPVEAMASGIPVVASDVGGLRDLLVDPASGANPSGQRYGVLVKPEDPHDLATAVAGIVADPAAAAEMASRAHRWVAENRTWAQVARTYRAAYEGLGAVLS